MAIRLAVRRGYAHLAEDFAQEVLLIHVERPNRRGTLNQYFIDFLRKTYGASRVPNHVEARLRLAFPLPILDMDFPDPRYLIDEDEIPRHESYRHLFTDRKLRIYDLVFIEGLRFTKAAKILGVSLSRISHIVNDEMKPYILKHKR